MVSNIQVVIRAFEGFSERVVKSIILDSTANLIEDTPVDLGWARANWIPSIGPPPSGPVGEADVGDPDVGAARSAQQDGISRIAVGYRLSQGNVSITNNVPYIRRLNEGSSAQAPAAFVQSAIARALDKANQLRSP